MFLVTLSTVAAVLSILAAFVAVRTADSLSRDRHRFSALRSACFEMQAEHEKLAARFVKLQGLFYALRAEVRQGGIPEASSTQAREMIAGNGEPCPNWSAAQRKGPASEEAACGCDYCVEMRILRHNVKAELVPKSQAARIDAIKRGLAQPQ